MEKIDIAKLLKNCPKGMELDCTTWENVSFEEVVNNEIYIKRNNKIPSFDNIVILNQYGCVTNHEDEKCRIFPKGKTTWEGFVPPCEFKDGDVIVDKYGAVAIYKRVHSSYEEPYVDFYCGISSTFRSLYIKDSDSLQHCGRIDTLRLATEEEKQELFQAIKEKGYRWNEETKTLEKLLKPKFKVGNKIVDILRKHEGASGTQGVISEITDDKYIFTDSSYISISNQDNWELAPTSDKFDINTLKSFESKVLVRDSNKKWRPAIYGFCDKFETRCAFYVVGGCIFEQCIPYEDNEHLLGKTNDCNEFYKIWEK